MQQARDNYHPELDLENERAQARSIRRALEYTNGQILRAIEGKRTLESLKNVVHDNERIMEG